MKITNIQKAQQVRKVEGVATEEKTAPGETQAKDVVKLSRASEELTAIALQATPEKVDFEALKEAIRSGDYQPDLDRLADKMTMDPATIDSLLES